MFVAETTLASLTRNVLCVILATCLPFRNTDGRCQETSAKGTGVIEQSDAVTFARVLLEGNAEYAANLGSFYCTFDILARSKPDGRGAILTSDAPRSETVCNGVWLYSPEQEFLELRPKASFSPIDSGEITTGGQCTDDFWRSIYFRHEDFEGNYTPDFRTFNLFAGRTEGRLRTLHNPLSFWKSGDGNLFPTTRTLERLLDGSAGPVTVSVSENNFGLTCDLEIVEVSVERSGAKVFFGFDVNSGFALRWYRRETENDFVEALVSDLQPLESGGWFPMTISRVIGNSESDLHIRDQIVVTKVSSGVDWKLGKVQVEKGTCYFEPSRPLGYRVLSEPETIGPTDLEGMMKRTLVPKPKASQSGKAGSWIETLSSLSLTHWIVVGTANLLLLSIIVISWRKMNATPLFASKRSIQKQGR